jgi:outer membrane protein TolC
MTKSPDAMSALRAREGYSDNDASAIQVEGTVRPAAKSVLQTNASADLSGFAEFAGANTNVVTTDTLAALTSLAEEMLARERDVRDAAAKLVTANENLRVIKEERLPDLMESKEVTRFDFKDKITGISRTILLDKDKWRVAMPPKSGKNADPMWEMKHAAVMEWAVEIGQAGIIKKDVEIPCGLMSDEDVMAFAAKIKEAKSDADVTISKYIEPASLTALVNRKLKAGETVNEYIVTHPVREAKVKGAK